MFGRKDKIDNKELTLVGSNSKIDGDINFLGRCHVDGTVNGNIRADLESESPTLGLKGADSSGTWRRERRHQRQAHSYARRSAGPSSRRQGPMNRCPRICYPPL